MFALSLLRLTLIRTHFSKSAAFHSPWFIRLTDVLDLIGFSFSSLNISFSRTRGLSCCYNILVELGYTLVDLFHHSVLAPTWTAFLDYTGPDLLCSTVFHF